MEKVGFFTAVSFGDQPKSCTESLLETVDSYFYLGIWDSKKACVIAPQPQASSREAVLIEDSPAFVVTALKVISYLTIILPVVLLMVKAVLRSIHSFQIIDPRAKLEEGIDISPATMEQLETLMPKIEAKEDDPDIEWYLSDNNRVFSLTSAPDLIFKMVPRRSDTFAAEERSEHRFANMVKAQEVCLAHHLDLLVIPHAKKFEVAGRTLIAEQRIQIDQREGAQKQCYQKLGGLNETARQLATFIAKTGWSDVVWDNMPIVDDAPEFQGNRRAALTDLEHMVKATDGIFGRNCRGLLRCLGSEEQMKIALAEARRHQIVHPDYTPQQVIARRMQEIQEDQELHQFYVRNGLLENPLKPIQVDLNSLGLNLDEQWMQTIVFKNGILVGKQRSVTLREVAGEVIAQINQEIARAPANSTPQARRSILLNRNHGILSTYKDLGYPSREKTLTAEAADKQRWIWRIIDALVDQGHLFKLEKYNGHGYFIQA